MQHKKAPTSTEKLDRTNTVVVAQSARKTLEKILTLEMLLTTLRGRVIIYT